MNQHRNTKTIQQYKDTKQRLQKETRRAYWNYLKNIICYDENSEKLQKQKKFLQSVGTSPLDKDVLNMVVRRGANSCAYCLRIREYISSGPVAELYTKH
jgi:hypothetical protein